MLLLNLLRFLQRERIHYVVVGDSENYFQEIHGDVDFVVDSQSLVEIHHILAQFCRQQAARIVQILRHEQAAWYYVLAWRDGANQLRFLHPDICGDYFRRGTLFLEAAELLTERVRTVDGSGNSFYTPRPASGFIYYLLKKVDKGELNDSHGRYLSGQWQRDAAASQEQLRRFWPEREADGLAQAAATNSWESVRAKLPALRLALRRGLPFSPKHFYSELKRKIDRVTRPTGAVVAMLGADGAGKSTVLAQVERDLAPAFRRTKRYHLRPHFGRSNADGPPVPAPHSKPPRSWPASMIKLGLWWTDYTSGYLCDVLPRVIHSTLVLYDRYYYDLAVDARRYRYGGSRRLAELVGRFVPRPHLTILLEAAAETLQARKQEVPLQETVRQQTAYRTLISKFATGHSVDAARPLREVVAAVDDLVLEFMAARTARRFGLARSDDVGH
jgi:thymidylate kinase